MIRSTICKRSNSTLAAIKKTPLYDLHVELGGTMVPFAGYSMPVNYKGQTHIESHNWTRTNAGLFDVSHMMQSKLTGLNATDFLHKVTPTDFKNLSSGHGTLSVLLNKTGGIVDDTMITKVKENDFYVVTNAGCIKRDTEFLNDEVNNFDNVKWDIITDRSLLALQGPKSSAVLSKLLANGQTLNDLFFGMRKSFKLFDGTEIEVARSGYTGEDGFEISILNDSVNNFARLLLDNDVTKPIGLAARDSLRLEAGMCLYGHELNEEITPIEAGLNWLVSKDRRSGDKGKFNGYEKINDQLVNKNFNKLRVLFKYEGKGPSARTDAEIYDSEKNKRVGIVTSGSPSPSLGNINVGQAYVDKAFSKKGTNLTVMVRNKFYPITIGKGSLVPTHYYRN